MNTKKATLYLTGVCAAVAAICGAAMAQDAQTPAIASKLDVAYVGRYIWRGIPQTSKAALQPSLTVSHKSGLSFNFWASQDVDVQKVTENDYTFNYAWTAKGLGMNAGYIYYAFPNTSYLSTSEVYASVAFPVFLTPTLSINYDIDEADGFYASLGAGYGFALGGKSAPTLSVSGKVSFSSGSYNDFWFGEDKSALSDLYLSASLPIILSEKTTLTPAISYSSILDSELSEKVADPDNLVGSLTLSCAF